MTAPTLDDTQPIDAVYCIDALELLRSLPDASVDLICTDPPYEATNFEWDGYIDWRTWFTEALRVCKPEAPIVMTANMRTAVTLINAAGGKFRYDWVWQKTMAVGAVNANVRPLSGHEHVLVFGEYATASGTHENHLAYYPQYVAGAPYYKARSSKYRGHNGDGQRVETANNGYRYPTTVIRVSNANHNSLHPTQKPLALMEYLIRTYTREGDLVLDCFCGSGTTLVAAKRLDRRFIGGDTDAGYCDVARGRLDEPYTFQLFAESEGAS